jgi:hypothetical protein
MMQILCILADGNNPTASITYEHFLTSNYKSVCVLLALIKDTNLVENFEVTYNVARGAFFVALQLHP